MGAHLSSDYAWKVYNFINAYKSGDFGFVSLQEAIDKHFDIWQTPPPLKHQIGEV